MSSNIRSATSILTELRDGHVITELTKSSSAPSTICGPEIGDGTKRDILLGRPE